MYNVSAWVFHAGQNIFVSLRINIVHALHYSALGVYLPPSLPLPLFLSVVEIYGGILHNSNHVRQHSATLTPALFPGSLGV